MLFGRLSDSITARHPSHFWNRSIPPNRLPRPLDPWRDFLEILEDRGGAGSTLITSQFPVDIWPELFGEQAAADAIVDRLVPNAHRIDL